MKLNKKISRQIEVKKLLGSDFLQLLSEVSPLVSPRIDVFTTNQYFYVLADLAGIWPEEINIKIHQNHLIIEGVIPNRLIMENAEIYLQERFYGPFHREILLPNVCSLKEIKVEYDSGILIIQIPLVMTEKEKETQVEIQIDRSIGNDKN